ncbi:Trimethylguanosine synthase [Psidium guajava]|nr:Trimethylguanosine synthase [Psidium guajava]
MDTLHLDGEEEDAPAIRALGSLFKLTQVFLWDYGPSTEQELPPSTGASNPPHRGDSVGSNIVSTSPDYSPLREDLELIREMNELGLPLAFQTSKKKNRTSKVRKKRTHKKHDNGEEIENEGARFLKVSEPIVVSHTVVHDNPSGFLCSMSVSGQSEISCYDNAVDASKFCSTFDNEQDLAEIICVSKETICTGISDVAIDCQDCHAVLTDSVPKEELGGNEVESNLLDHISPANHVEAVVTHCDSYEKLQSLEEVAVGQTTEVLQQEPNNNGNSCGDWIVCWDSLCQRNYYYNSITQVSTWFPPTQMEDIEAALIENPESNARLAELTKQDVSLSVSSACLVPGDTCVFQHTVDSLMDHDKSLGHPFVEADSVVLKDCGEDATSQRLGDISMNGPADISLEENNLLVEVGDSLDNLHSLSGSHTSKLKTVARSRRRRKSLHINEDLSFPLSEEYCTVIEKYWFQRYLLFSRFDEGIKMDEEGWFSVTPQSIAKHHAVRCGGGIIVDGFTGVGGNAIQFAQMGRHVIAVDIDPKKIEYAQHNAVIYDVDGKIDFVKGDFFILARNLKADTVFLSPPWGGPGYTKVKTYNMKTMLKPHDGFFLFNIAKEIACKVVMFLPKNVDLNQLAELALSVQPPWSLEVEKNYLNGKLKAVTAYFSNAEVCRK